MLTKTKTIITVGVTASLVIAAVASTSDVNADTTAASTTLNVTVSDYLSVGTTGVVAKSLTIANNSTDTSKTDSITTATNNLSGYYISIKNNSTNTALTTGTYTIPAGTSITAGTSSWAIKCSASGITYLSSGTDSGATVTPCNSTWFAVPASNGTAKVISTGALSSVLSTAATTTFTYGVATSTTQAAGAYSTTVSYTVTARS